MNLRPYQKFIMSLVGTVFVGLSTFGVQIAAETQATIMSFIPTLISLLGTIAVFRVPNKV